MKSPIQVMVEKNARIILQCRNVGAYQDRGARRRRSATPPLVGTVKQLAAWS